MTLEWIQILRLNIQFVRPRRFGFSLQSCNIVYNRACNRAKPLSFFLSFQQNFEKRNAERMKAVRTESQDKIDTLSKQLEEALKRLSDVEKSQKEQVRNWMKCKVQLQISSTFMSI